MQPIRRIAEPSPARAWAARAAIAFFALAWRLTPRTIARVALSTLRQRPCLADRFGFHVRRIHYYEPLPDFASIDAATLDARRSSRAVDFTLPAQLERLLALAARWRDELEALANTPEGDLPWRDRYFGSLDSAVYYALLRERRPRRVIEVGVGTSTRIAARALARNRAEGAPGELIGIDPFPAPRLTDHDAEVTLHRASLAEVPLALFDELGAGDVLFLDAEHVVTHGSATCRVFLDVLPRLREGVLVHVHDIYLPTDYPPEGLINARVAYNEQYMLEAFLAFNTAFEPRLALRWLWLDHRAELSRAWPERTLPREGQLPPTGFWMERVAAPSA